MGRGKHLTALVGGAALLAACDPSNAAPDPTCLQGGGGTPIAIPTDTTVDVGAQFSLIYRVSGSCQTGQIGVATWRTSDSTLIKLDAQSGHVTALKSGDAFVQSDKGADAHIRIR